MKFSSVYDWLKILMAAAVLAITFIWSGLFQPRPKIAQPKYNILVLSLCSFKFDALTFYGWNGPEVMPHMEKFFRESTYSFENAINGLPWVGIFSFTKALFSSQWLFQLGYNLPGNTDDHQTIWIPSMTLDVITSASKVTLGDRSLRNNVEKNFEPSNSVLQSRLQNPLTQPFFTIVNFKYLHDPLIDHFNADAQWDYFLNADEKKTVHEYISHPKKYRAKAPLLLLLTGSPELLAGRPKIDRLAGAHEGNKLSGKVLGLMSSPELIEPWKRSAGYSKDLEIIAKIYHANLRYVDKLLAPYLDLFGNEELRKKTIVIVVGDHGVLHMDHDELTHADSVYEKNVRVPMAIKFPGAKARTVISDQLHFETAARLIEGLASGSVNQDNLADFLKRHPSDVAIMRDCSNAQRGLRYKNEYKYFVRVSDGRKYLFDLKQDPAETKNIATLNPRLTDKMELLYWQNFDQLSGVDAVNCTP